MPALLSLIDRLPSVYRPEPDDGTLLTTLLGSVGAELDSARDDVSMLLPAHWVLHADRAAFDPWFTTRRARLGLPALVPTDQLDYSATRDFLIAVKDANTPLTEFLREAFGTALQAELDAWDDLQQPPGVLQRRALDGLTRVVRGPLIFDAERFDGITLSPGTIADVQSNPAGAERTAVNVQLMLEAFPNQLRRATLDLSWVRDLGRLGALIPIVPWREPLSLRETVEAFRIRLVRMVELYRNGLGTVDALRTVVAATLPVDFTLAPELRDRPFSIEEFTTLTMSAVAAPTNGPPDNLVGPLMRWSIENPGVVGAPAALLITGLTPGPGIAATTDPMIELLQAGSARSNVAIGFNGTIAPDQTLRLRPAYALWTLGTAALQRADSLPSDDAFADPTEFPDSAAVNGAPVDIAALFWTSDGMLWAAADSGVTLRRFDGATWTEVATGLPSIRCFAEQGDALLMGTANGIMRAPLFPGTADDPVPVALPDFNGLDIRTIVPQYAGSERWIGTDGGALRWDGSAPPVALALGGAADIPATINCIDLDRSGAVHFGCDLGVLEFQPVRDTWFWYAGDAFTEQSPEWRAFAATPNGTPANDRVFIPNVLAIRRGSDASLWFATERGIARYVAIEVDNGTYTTRLEAFPDLCDGPVTEIHEDARGGVWFCTERGVLRFDGRDFWQREAGGWNHLGRADLFPGIVARERGSWRFDRANDVWQRFETNGAGWIVPVVEFRTSDEDDVVALVITDHVVADLGTFAGESFTHAADVNATDIYMHIKPDEERIVVGGMAYIPRLPAGISKWRYLSREVANLQPPPAEDRPAWTTEGRLFPPPPALEAPFAARFDVDVPPDGHFDQAVFAYDPAAKVTFEYEPHMPCTVLVRLYRRAGDAPFDPAVLDRVWEGIQLVRPAGVRALLAVDESIVRGS